MRRLALRFIAAVAVVAALGFSGVAMAHEVTQSNRVFTITAKTRLVRAGKPVKAAELAATKDEKVAVVVDHDKPGDEALEVRFAQQ